MKRLPAWLSSPDLPRVPIFREAERQINARAREVDPQLIELRDRLLSNFREFTDFGWALLHDGQTPVREKYLDLVAEHYQAVAEREILWLLMSLPPRTGKTIIGSVLFHCWLWARNPTTRLLTGSFSENRCTTDSRLMRIIITHPSFQRLWPIQLATDGNQVGRYNNTAGGYRYTVLYGSAGTGDGGDILTLDDPQCAADMHSPTGLRQDHAWFNNTWLSRRNNKTGPQESQLIVQAQRLGPFDLINQIRIDNPNRWEVLNLEAVKTSVSMGTYYRDQDGRVEHVELPFCNTALTRSGRCVDDREPGDLLTERLPLDAIEIFPKDVQAAQLQQRPQLVIAGSAMVHAYKPSVNRKSFSARMGMPTLAAAIQAARKAGWIVSSGHDHGIGVNRQVCVIVIYHRQLKELWVVGEYQSQGRASTEQNAMGIRMVLDRLELPPGAVVASRGDVGHAGAAGSGDAGFTLNMTLASQTYSAGPRKGEKILGFPITVADKGQGSVTIGVSLLNEGFGGGSMFVDDSCQGVNEALQLWVGGEQYKDTVDALRYIARDPLEAWLYQRSGGPRIYSS